MDFLADPKHPDHAECAAWVAEVTGSGDPFDLGFLDFAAVTLSSQTCLRIARHRPARGARRLAA
ncbi:hypothetical protein AB0N65_10130 [Paenarthrobacter sp. NPDC089322]|uniref:hypothetical protein n=1 Tax=Paenarthrobacter sp. NPDC089322 TaxID=3155065 RepID=UPI0034323DEA